MSREVLIVDDSATTRKMITRAMKMAGLRFGEVLEASNGIEALACLGDRSVCVMLADINMPAMNGIQLLKRMKQDPRLREIPVVIVSTEGSEERVQEIAAVGAYAFVRKPFQPEQIRDVLMPLLGVKDDVQTDDGSAGDDLF